MGDAIVLEGVTKTFGPKAAVSELDLVVPEGGLYGFIGPNGAGKTTTIRMIMSILFPDRGKLRVLGHRSALEAKDRIGYLPEERGVYRKMKVGAFLNYVARLKGCEGSDVKRRVHQWLERVGLEDVEKKKCEELSKGMQQKIQFISSVIHEPDLIILDEPFSGLDPVNMRLLRDLVLEQHQRGATIVFSTHVMVQAEQICDHVFMINDGLKVLDESLDRIRTKYDPRTILFDPLRAGSDVDPVRSVPGVHEMRPVNGSWEISLVEGTDPSAVIREVASRIPTARIELHRPSLEDVFLQIVTGTTGAGTDEVERLRAALRDDGSMEVQA